MLIRLSSESRMCCQRQVNLNPVLLAVIVVIIATVLAIGARNWLIQASSVDRRNFVTAATKTPMRIETELVTIRRHGFEPVEIIRPAGPFVLAVENRSGIEDVALQLNAVSGVRLKEVLVPQTKLDWRDFFDLAPGDYSLTEANHPGWICHLTITAR